MGMILFELFTNGALAASDAAPEDGAELAVTNTVWKVVAVVTITDCETAVRLVEFHWTRTPPVT